MKTIPALIRILIVTALCVSMWFFPNIVGAHCDTLEGPVVKAAKTALEKGDVTPVLKWVKKEYETEIKDAFKRTLSVRIQSQEARELADMYFFETLVRFHRAGEGAPYTGLKPGEAVEPVIVEADKALESDSVDILTKLLTDAVVRGVHKRFAHTIETKKHADESVEAGREFVEAYVEFTHYVERLHLDSTGQPGHSLIRKIEKNETCHH